MKTTEKYTIVALLLISFIFIDARCQKDVPLPVCSGNCTEIIFSGSVLNAPYSLPIRNAQIEVTTPGDYRPVDTTYIVGTVKTDADGNFSLIKSIDTTIHKIYYIKATMPSGYLTSLETSDQYTTNPDNTSSQYFYLNDSGIQRIQFEAFPITRLKINLHRTSSLPTNITYSNFTFSVNDGIGYPIGLTNTWFQETSKNTDTVVYIETSPVVNTVIQWDRTSNTSLLSKGSDSISCQPNITNQISITY
jgi:hypothetical protein